MKIISLSTLIAVFVSIVFLASPVKQAWAYCLQNQTGEKLYFVAREHMDTSSGDDNPSFYWIENGAEACCDWRDRSCNRSGRAETTLDYYVFSDDQALEGCSTLMRADVKARLTIFEEFDRCDWVQGR